MFKKSHILSALLFGLLISCSSSGFADPLDDKINTSIQNYLASVQDKGVSAVQLSVLLPNETQPRNYVTGTKYYGTSNKTPATTDMMLQWGSITKEYTNVLVFKLIQKGKFTLDNTLVQLFPENFSKDQNNAQIWPDAWRDVKLYQLMNMTSGIPDYGYSPSSPDGDHTSPQPHYSLEDLVDLAAQVQNSGCIADDGCFPAGSNYFYSNTNYIILGKLVEKYSGHSFSHEMDHLLKPFQKSGDDAYYYVGHSYPNFILNNMIHGYFSPTEPAEIIDVTNWDMSWGASAGAMLGSMSTLVNMTKALYTATPNQPNNLVPIDLLKQHMVSMDNGKPVTDPNTECNDDCYAMGIVVSSNPGFTPTWFYEGGTQGYSAIYLVSATKDNQKFFVAGSFNTTPSGKASSIDIAEEVVKVDILVNQYLSPGNSPLNSTMLNHHTRKTTGLFLLGSSKNPVI